MEFFTFSRSKWNTLFPLSHHWLITHNVRGRALFLSPTLARASPFACHSRVTFRGYLKLSKPARRLSRWWSISYKSLCFVDPSLALMVSFLHSRGGEVIVPLKEQGNFQITWYSLKENLLAHQLRISGLVKSIHDELPIKTGNILKIDQKDNPFAHFHVLSCHPEE